MRVKLLLVMAIIEAVAFPAHAQTGMKFSLTRVGTKTTATVTITAPGGNPQPVDPTKAQQIAADRPLVVELECAAPVDCRSVSVRLPSGTESDGAVPTGTNAQRTARWEFTPGQFANKTNLRLKIADGTNEVSTIGLETSTPKGDGGGQNAGAGAVQSLSEPLATLRTYDCSPELSIAASNLGDHTYSRQENVATLLMDVNGNIWNRPPVDSVDENDRVEVRVVAHPDLLRVLRIRRTSPFRVPGALNIVGADATVPSLGDRKATGRTPCEIRTVKLADFQPGRGEVTVSAITDKGDVPTGTAEFGVNTLYSGAFALGAIHTWLRDPEFGLVSNGTDSVITRTADRTPRVLYTLTYTPFIWGKRDLEKGEPPLNIRRLNPTFGLVLSDIQNNFVVGATYDLFSTVYLSGGLHLGHVRRLNPDAGYAEGEAFPGASKDLPVSRDWRSSGFIGISLDLRAAALFIQKAMGTPTK
jgi:hypothetical protein